jgi:DNA-binding transcriptional LysR family regulator
MLDWNDLRYFLAIAREGTLARAAKRLGINATTVSRRLAALEGQTQARLFDRTPDGYVLTPSGLDLMPRAERMENEAIALDRDVIGADQRTAGSVRLTGTEMLVTRFIMPHLPRFHALYPEISLDLECTTRRVSLARREADIALRLSRPHEENVVTRRLASVPLSLYAAPAYIERHGLPRDADASLAGHRMILFADSRGFAVENDWLLERLDGGSIVLRSDSVSSIYSATVAGVGIALLPVAAARHDPSLRAIETSTSPPPRIIWQAVHADLQRSARVRAVLDFLAEIVVPMQD